MWQQLARGGQLLSLIEACLLWLPHSPQLPINPGPYDQLHFIILRPAHSFTHIPRPAKVDMGFAIRFKTIVQRFWDTNSLKSFTIDMFVFIHNASPQRTPGPSSLEKPPWNITPDSAHSWSCSRLGLFLGCVFHFFFGHFYFFPALRSVCQLPGGQFRGLDEAGFSVIATSPEPVWSLGFASESLNYSLLGSWHFASS